MIRPEAQAQLARWREAIIGAGLILLGAYWAFFTGGGLLHWIGYGLIGIGGILVVAGFQRARFRSGQAGPGMVQVVEGRITYFGPLTGGVADIKSLSALTLDPTAEPPHWLLQQPGQPALAIPLGAAGGDALFDAFASLPGIRTEYMLRQMSQLPAGPVVIWRASDVHQSIGKPTRLH
ncbi:hypothetical protein [Thalassococcus lentus]|uniref:Uncharacterized protein n=1 Tax=Thalassococcus lentus TaxID=1210524 RepID=A0ABT4XX45_9RHOB|nr:hypothetical protein [Thalassococcus lentus]MDA7426410.1 hypothetical protein [Thalassococcus lentus]